MSDFFDKATANYLSRLQTLDTQLDSIVKQKGVFPRNVATLSEEIETLGSKKKSLIEKQQEQGEVIRVHREKIKEAEELIDKYNEELKNTKNDRQYEVINEDLEVQKLEIKLLKRRVAETKQKIQFQDEVVTETDQAIEHCKKKLENQKKMLSDIEEKSSESEKKIAGERLQIIDKIPNVFLSKYNKIRSIEKDAIVDVIENTCNGCFIRVPIQQQIDIKTQKKIQTCDSCGRILMNVIAPVVQTPKRTLNKTLRRKSVAAGKKTK